ncbi:hypothetical protein E5F05_07850 [Deinococcus metallilatus]|uniref:Uncharacterized protein n=1 Tax=Deinococcus metallilatus TaxID=1211322 RepID=A0AAE6D4H5_9DEIO|nr:hypothetical protein [Deinococcus metallilatus]MBB5296991.1 hypothetical protein [Deinococcus metallilatus]QBY07872.1 hypothetical protein E5F05_07850 [Deinococcus metallilatus]RXJ13221.1 hypothetical protein ERJ73_06675 [Deinococcus metallilatus]TLK23006.1 hypothetical protein FCS05_16640 [Deinococcus metallilatus]GMA15957.1 hypothetical protein GCM10025871_22880 [Deinococcus metallilatus]
MRPEHSGGTLIEVRGAWHGRVGDPERRFAGVVTASERPDVRAGDSVVVTYHAAASRTTDAHQHGSYTLDVGGRTLLLMGFTCHDTGMTGQEGNNDTTEATWQAVTLPGATGRGG